MPLIERLPELRRARAALVTERQKLREEYIKLVEREGAEPLEPDEKSRIDTLTDGLKAHDDQIRDHETRIARAETALGFEADKAKDTEDGGDGAASGRDAGNFLDACRCAGPYGDAGRSADDSVLRRSSPGRDRCAGRDAGNRALGTDRNRVRVN